MIISQGIIGSDIEHWHHPRCRDNLFILGVEHNEQARVAKAMDSKLRQHATGIGLELIVNVLMPYLVYTACTDSLGKVGALMASSVPPIAWTVVGFIRERKVDAISIMVVAGIAMSLLAFAGGGGVKFLQLRENLVTGLTGMIFLGSAAMGKPLFYQLARAGMQRRSADQLEAFEARSGQPGFRRAMMLITLVWGSGFLASCAINCVLVFRMSIKEYLLVSPPIGYATIGLLIGWTFWYSRRARRRNETPQSAPVPEAPAMPEGDPDSNAL